MSQPSGKKPDCAYQIYIARPAAESGGCKSAHVSTMAKVLVRTYR